MITKIQVKPKNGKRFKVLGICRVSTDKQDERSLVDQEELLHQYLRGVFDTDTYDMEVVSTVGRGEDLTRGELARSMAMVKSDQCDLIIMEDLGRLMRRLQVLNFLELCDDYNTRMIAINDKLDTAEGNSSIVALISAYRHEAANRDTSMRIKRSLHHRFQTEGLVVALPRFGYIRPRQGARDHEILKDPSAEPIIREVFDRLNGGASYSEIADYLNTKSEACKRVKKGWTSHSVSKFIHNPILKGYRFYGKKHSKRFNQTGKYRSVRSKPESVKFRLCPNLAFIEPATYDQIIAELDKHNKTYRGERRFGPDPKTGRARRRTRWPGQHMYCSACGRLVTYAGPYASNEMRCYGSQDYLCWNSWVVYGDTARQKIIDAIFTEIRALPDFDDGVRNALKRELIRAQANGDEFPDDMKRQLVEIDRQIKNLVDTVAHGGFSASVLSRLAEQERQKSELEVRIKQIERPHEEFKLPSVAKLKEKLTLELQDIKAKPPEELGRLLRMLIPKIWVVPYKLVTLTRVYFRAEFELDLTSFFGKRVLMPTEAREHLKRRMTVDLFDLPKYVQLHRESVKRHREGANMEQIARELKTSAIMVGRALKLQLLMEKQGVDSVLLPITGPEPWKFTCRTRHKRYRFQPAEGHTPMVLFPEAPMTQQPKS